MITLYFDFVKQTKNFTLYVQEAPGFSKLYLPTKLGSRIKVVVENDAEPTLNPSLQGQRIGS